MTVVESMSTSVKVATILLWAQTGNQTSNLVEQMTQFKQGHQFTAHVSDISPLTSSEPIFEILIVWNH